MHATPTPGSPDQGCAAFLAALDAVVDGMADALSVARTEAHAARCAGCARRLAHARRYRDRMRRAGAAERAPDTLQATVRSILDGVRGSRTR